MSSNLNISVKNFPSFPFFNVFALFSDLPHRIPYLPHSFSPSILRSSKNLFFGSECNCNTLTWIQKLSRSLVRVRYLISHLSYLLYLIDLEFPTPFSLLYVHLLFPDFLFLPRFCKVLYDLSFDYLIIFNSLLSLISMKIFFLLVIIKLVGITYSAFKFVFSRRLETLLNAFLSLVENKTENDFQL